jgi:hypothetical protein
VEETRGEKLQNPTKNAYLENPPHRTLVDPQHLVQRVVERGAIVSKLLPQRLLGLGLVKMSRRRAGVLLLLLRVRHGDIWGGRPARDDEVSVSCIGCRGITQPSSRITSTPAAGSGAGAGEFSYWPHPGGGASSSGISTTAA